MSESRANLEQILELLLSEDNEKAEEMQTVLNKAVNRDGEENQKRQSEGHRDLAGDGAKHGGQIHLSGGRLQRPTQDCGLPLHHAGAQPWCGGR